MSDIRVIGSLRTTDGKGVVRMDDRFDTNIDEVWRAFTERDRLARWLGDFEGDLRVGGEFRAHFFASDWTGSGRVDVCAAPGHLVVTTSMLDHPEEVHAVEVTLTADGGHTVLGLEERGMPVELLPDYGAGIQVHVEDLAAHLAGRERVDAATRWAELRPAYAALVS